MASGKKTLALFLAMIIMLAPVSGAKSILALGTGDFEGEGTSGEPYLIETAEQLDKLRGAYLSAGLYYELTGPINLSDYTSWNPIGTEDEPFQGYFDGNGYTVTGLSIDEPDIGYVGLFGYMSTDSMIVNINLSEAVVNGLFAVGGLAGGNDGGTIRNASFSGQVSGESETGGLIGFNNNGKIEYSHTQGSVHGDELAGGLIGFSIGSGTIILGSSSSSEVSGSNGSSEIGGLVGSISGGTITNSHASGNVTGGNDGREIGGLVGDLADTSIYSSYASGHVSGQYRIGGLVGEAWPGETISDSHASGNVSGEQRVGGLVGSNYRTALINNYATGEVTGINFSISIGGLAGENSSADITNSYATGPVSGEMSVGGLVGDNQDSDIEYSHASGAVTGNYDVGGLVGYNIGEISRSHAVGTVHGTEDSQSVGGLIGSNIGTVNYSYALGDVNAIETNFFSGGLVGSNHGEIQNSFTSGNVSGGAYQTGGLAGSNAGSITGSFASGDVRGTEYVGGLVGYNAHAISDSYASGKIDGVNYIGGLVAFNLGSYGYNGTVRNSYSSGSVASTYLRGGLISYNDDGTIINSFYDRETVGGGIGSDGGTALWTSQMQDAASYEADTVNAWDFVGRWAIDPLRNSGYPYLREIQAYLDFDGNGATGGQVPDSHSYMPGTAVIIGLGSDPVTNTGHSFDGWNTDPEGEGIFYRAGDSFTITATTTLFAIWKPHSTLATLTSEIGTVSTGGTANETITDIPYGTTLAELKAAITPADDATFEVYDEDGATVATVLTTGKIVIVTAQDGTTQSAYTVSLTTPSDEKDIIAFSLPQQTNAAAIDALALTVQIELPYDTDVSQLVASFTLSADATARVNGVVQVSGSTVNDFSAPAIYEVEAEDGSTQDWTVTVSLAAAPSSEKNIIAFSLPQQTNAAAIDALAHTVEIEVPHNTDASQLVASFTLSADATARVNGVVQVSGSTVNNFSTPVIYEVEAEDGSTQDWTVSVTLAAAPPSPANGGYSGGPLPGTIDAVRGGTVTLNGVRIELQPHTMDGVIQVTVNKIGNSSVLVLPDESLFSLASGIYSLNKDKAGNFKVAATITLPFDQNIIDFTVSTIGLYGLDEQNQKWVLLDNQDVDQANGAVSGTAYDFGIFAVFISDIMEATEPGPPLDNVLLLDIEGHWAETGILEMVRRGAIDGYTDQTFKPDQRITRAEFVSILAKALHLEPVDKLEFPDTKAHWARNEIEAAASLGIVNGYDDHTFRPDDWITREQMAAIIVRAMKFESSEGTADFTDRSEISNWARIDLATAAAAGIIKGYEDGSVRPTAHASRAEAAIMILRALQVQAE